MSTPDDYGNDDVLVAALRRGDDAAFGWLTPEHSVRVARRRARGRRARRRTRSIPWPGRPLARPLVVAAGPVGGEPEARLMSDETLAFVRDAISELPPTQQTVITLRDIDGWDSGDVCNALEISETNQRVLLHRARSKVRRALEVHIGGEVS